MKKIGCVIAYRKGQNNYGTSLQGYAMLKKIQQMGYSVDVINYEKLLGVKDKFLYVLNAIRCGEKAKLFKNSQKEKFYNSIPEYKKIVLERTAAVNAYKEKKLIPMFRTYRGFKNLSKGSLNYDAVVVGSDQVWTPLSLPNKFYNLLFVTDSVRKIAYASSFGVSDIPKFQKKATGEYLDRFYKIGVREERGKEIVEELSHQTAEVVADPTLLLTREEWEQEVGEIISESTLANINEAERAPYIFCYFLGRNSESWQAALRLQKRTGLRIIAVRHMDEYVDEFASFGDVAPAAMDPNDFVRYIAKAKYVCTDSFHCTVFSTIFHKQCMTFYRFAKNSMTGRNSRIDSLFNVLKISRDHIYDGDIDKIDSSIDWKCVDEKLSELRKRSVEFLRNSLG